MYMRIKKVLFIIVLSLILLAFLFYEIYSSTKNGRQTASNGQFILSVLGILGGFLIGRLLYNNPKTRIWGIVGGILFFLFFVWLSTTQIVFAVGLITTIILSFIAIYFLIKNLFKSEQ